MKVILWYKEWLETRSRFLLGAALVLGVCAFFVLANPMILWHWREDMRLHPELSVPGWLPRAMADYPFFIWHFLFRSMLQQVWMLFAVLLGLGGLATEGTQGVVGFTLSLPVSRLRLIGARTAVGCAEVVALGLIPAVAIPLLSLVIGKPYPVTQGTEHSLLLVAGGIVFYALGMFLAAIVKSEYTPALIGVALLAVLFFILSPYADGAPEPLWVMWFDVAKVMAGTPDLASWREASWPGVGLSLMTAALLFQGALWALEKRDY